jgi:hypothetical protein
MFPDILPYPSAIAPPKDSAQVLYKTPQVPYKTSQNVFCRIQTDPLIIQCRVVHQVMGCLPNEPNNWGILETPHVFGLEQSLPLPSWKKYYKFYGLLAGHNSGRSIFK